MSIDFIGGITVQLSDMAPVTPAFSLIPGLTSLSGFGKTNPLVDVTDFDSAAKEYIAGLADGAEITAEFHYDADTGTNTNIVQLQTAVNNKTNQDMKVLVTDGTNTDTFDFSVVPLSWTINGGPEEVGMISFTLKITGDITKT